MPGNLINRSLHAGKTAYELLTASATGQNRLVGFGYDIAGNMVSNGSANYVYDAENRLLTTAGMTYTYDGDGKRVKKRAGRSTGQASALTRSSKPIWLAPSRRSTSLHRQARGPPRCR